MDTVRVLLADDNHGMLKILEEYFRSKGDVEVVGSVSDGAQVMAAICQHSPDVLLLDIILPRRDGFSILADMRALAPEARPKVIVLTGLSRDDFVAQAFDLGADYYMVKPFETKELIARVKAILRRTKVAEAENHEEVVFPNLVVNKTTYTVKLNGEEVQMPPKELELLFFLSSNPNKVYTRDQLLEYIWGYDFFGDSRTVDVHIKRLREKVEDPKHNWQIKTVWGIGYKFEVKQ